MHASSGIRTHDPQRAKTIRGLDHKVTVIGIKCTKNNEGTLLEFSHTGLQ
jgi:hypothetical protein